MAKYVDGFLLTVKKNRLKEYEKMATIAGKVWKKHGALSYFECVEDDLSPSMEGMKQFGFKKASKVAKDEVVVYSFIVFKSRAHRDQVNKKVMADSKLNESMCDPKNMPFSMDKFCYGGFKTMVDY